VNGSSLAPGASLDCTASHTITQADLDAGSFYNQACVDDGANGAAQACADVTTPGTQTPAITLDKASTTTTVTQVGQVVPYTYLVTNTGNITLTGVTVTDDKVATVSCPKTTLTPGESMTCTGSYTVTSGDFSAGGNLTNVATADSDQTGPVNDTVSIPIIKPTGNLFVTGTTCQAYLAGTATDITQVLYGVKGGKINNVAPGVFFYYTKFTASGTTGGVTITQTVNNGGRLFKIQQGQVLVYDSNCNRISSSRVTFTENNGVVVVNVTGLTSGSQYIISVKYDTGSPVGLAVSQPYPTFTYSFSDTAGGNDSLALAPKP
jgi:hypothetical protein